MQLIYGEANEGAVRDFVNARLDEAFTPNNSRAVGIIDRSGRLVAGWIWHNYNPDAATIEFSGASTTPRWMTRAILQKLFAYAFDGIGCQLVVTRNSAGNVRLHRQLARFGFSRFDIPRLFGRHEDAVVWTLTDDDWRASDFYLANTGGHCLGKEV